MCVVERDFDYFGIDVLQLARHSEIDGEMYSSDREINKINVISIKDTLEY